MVKVDTKNVPYMRPFYCVFFTDGSQYIFFYPSQSVYIVIIDVKMYVLDTANSIWTYVKHSTDVWRKKKYKLNDV